MRAVFILMLLLLCAYGPALAQTPAQMFNSYSSSRNFTSTFSTAADTTISSSNSVGAFTSNINSALASVSAAGGGIIHIPAPAGGGSYNATDWIAIPSNVAISCDAGSTIDFASLPTTRWAMVVNASLGATVNQNIGIHGCAFNMEWNGSNDATVPKFVPSPNNNSGTGPEMTYRMGMQFVGVDGLILDHVTVSNARNWSFAFVNTHNGYAYETTLDSYTSDGNGIGYSNEGTMQFQGPNSHWKIRNLRGTSNDDLLAYVHGWIMGPTMPPGDGPMQDIDVDGVFLNTDSTGPAAGLGNRIYARDPLNGIRVECNRDYIDNIRISNVVGRVRAQALEVGADGEFSTPGNYGAGNNGSISFSHVNISSAQSGASAGHPTNRYASFMYVNGYVDTLALSDFTFSSSGQTNSAPLWITSTTAGGKTAGNVKNLVLDGFRTTQTWSAPLIYVDSGATISNLFVKNWGGLSSSYYIQNGAGTVGAVNNYDNSTWSGKTSGTIGTYNTYASGSPSYTVTPASMPESYPKNVTYNSNGTLAWTDSGDTTFSVMHAYMYGIEPNGYTSPPTSQGATIIATVNRSTACSSGTCSYNLPAYTAGEWHILAVSGSAHTAPSRPIYAKIGQASGTWQNLGYIEGVSVTGSGPYTVTGTMTQSATITAPAGATVSYPTANSFQFTTTGGEGAIWGIGPGGAMGPAQLLLPSPATTTAKYTATMRASFR